jgi:hypothetical protein
LAGNDDIAEDMIDSAQIMKMTNNPINHEINKLHEFKKLYSDWKLQVWDTILSK